MIEERPIPSSPGYAATSDGHIVSLDQITFGRHLKRRILKPGWHPKNDYGSVDCRGKIRTVHSLVLEAFVGPRPEGMECRHLNGDRKDNRIENLRWGTRAENAQDRVIHGTDSKGERSGQAKLTEWDVVAIRSLAESEIPRDIIAEAHQVSQSTVSEIYTRQTWRHLA